MASNNPLQAAAQPTAWLVLLVAAGAFAPTMGTRQTMGLFLSSINTSTVLCTGSISLAFAFGQVVWGLMQPFAGAVADRIGTGHVIFLGVALVALGTFIAPYKTTTAGVFEATLSYDGVGYIDIVLALGAALIDLPIPENRLARLPAI